MVDLRYPVGRFVPPPSLTPDERAQLIHEIAEAPAALRAAVSGLSESERLTPYREAGWTVAQVVHHLSDSHLNAYARIKLALTADDPTITVYDEKRWAELPDAVGTDLEMSLALFGALHGRLAALLRRLSPAQFERPFVHPERGPLTVERNVALYAWHGRHHTAHITALRERMGW